MSRDAHDLPSDHERVLIAAWMLPDDGPLTPLQREQATANFARYVKQHKLTHLHVARALGNV